MTDSNTVVATNDDLEAATLSKALTACSRRAANTGEIVGNPLHDPALVALTRQALTDAKGPALSSGSPLNLTVWRGGALHTGRSRWILDGKVVAANTPGAAEQPSSPGVTFAGDLGTFVKILHKRAEVTMPKRRGWVVEPTINPTGVRTNAATQAMTAAFLDADECGPWDQTLTELDKINLCYVAYQSGGYSPTTPKWRLVIPFSRPFNVRDDSERVTWKKFYHRIRVLVGAIGGLTGVGFDPRVDAPSVPFFLGEKRNASDVPREVVFRPGHALDLTYLALSLPIIQDDVQTTNRNDHTQRSLDDVGEPMDDDELTAIVKELSAVTNSVPRGRRDLYLALPGALLDRGMHPDDVITVCSEVSLAYPHRHVDKHQDNCHSAYTTVAKFVAGDSTYTRIGTLQATHPDVAAVVDKVLPDLMGEAIAQAVSDSINNKAKMQVQGEVQTAQETGAGPKTEDEEASSTTNKISKKERLRKKIVKLAEEKSASKEDKDKKQGNAITLALAGTIDSLFDVRVRDESVKAAFDTIGFWIEKVTFDEIVEALDASKRISPDTYRAWATAFVAGRAKRVVWDADAPAREAKHAAKKQERQALTLRAFETGEI